MHNRRAKVAGGAYSFTVNLAERHSDLLVRHIEDLRTVMQGVKQAHPFAALANGLIGVHFISALRGLITHAPEQQRLKLRGQLAAARGGSAGALAGISRSVVLRPDSLARSRA